jgi:hypothetical protein
MVEATIRIAMERLLVEIGMVPPENEFSFKVSIRPEDKITFAVEMMLKNDRKQIAVTHGEKLLGVLRLPTICGFYAMAVLSGFMNRFLLFLESLGKVDLEVWSITCGLMKSGQTVLS